MISINNQEYKSFEIDAVTISISVNEYHNSINRQTYGLFKSMEKVETLLNRPTRT